ncbi:ADR311Cp [Eremothecium gossypii ATCC 10895]|uniref:Glycerol-3-phosphate dehydrogenase [NAD(+)] n=1 Tax=Eremothecium gossypii (strain ATCC 10895 / CBS 109.51 / FGSC 9923 / NRRL Y-1056) TaxID=284811 RepID=GPD_EREGS|nr:ADR311Cp [Eremothecium gossypii ATCC 10895]Q759G5.1 RecName: Full=Glycerol-3-phosphate dehydrogenase [NAD(+)] [Eremothecium gossypii ATCC 10895]AAS52231.1 ADR311Cp [Eremothecium gossypii ATCC 10895]AEY96530.1 FADR311Cp [Eremothecium gossypii FDAG1]
MVNTTALIRSPTFVAQFRVLKQVNRGLFSQTSYARTHARTSYTHTMAGTDRLQQTSQILSRSTSSEIRLERPFKVTVIGSGNWGTTIAKVVAENTQEYPQLFERRVDMWVFEEQIEGRKLTEIINEQHENVKYLPGITLPENLVANPSVAAAAADADVLVFNIPHQFLGRIVEQLKGHVKPGARAISCLKGFSVGKDGVQLLSTYIEEHLHIPCGALSGANLAPEVAKGNWSETTVAYTLPQDFRGTGKDVDHAVLKKLFHRPYFHVNVVDDVAGISVAGALKNVVALACGFVLGLGWGNNAAAAVQRVGLSEMIKFARMFFPESKVETFYQESAGVADLITTCAGGRNVRIGRAMAETGKSAQELEKELLNGQSSQGIYTTQEVHEWLQQCGKKDEFPLFEAVYKIVYEGVPMSKLPDMLEDA